jgi:hypothetical protein
VEQNFIHLYAFLVSTGTLLHKTTSMSYKVAKINLKARHIPVFYFKQIKIKTGDVRITYYLRNVSATIVAVKKELVVGSLSVLICCL